MTKWSVNGDVLNHHLVQQKIAKSSRGIVLSQYDKIGYQTQQNLNPITRQSKYIEKLEN
jgi:hypothetical protein